jgi:hypothetical protein
MFAYPMREIWKLRQSNESVSVASVMLAESLDNGNGY